MRVAFHAPWDYHTALRKNGTPRATQHYAAGTEVTLPREIAKAAVKAGRAKGVRVAPRPPEVPDDGG